MMFFANEGSHVFHILSFNIENFKGNAIKRILSFVLIVQYIGMVVVATSQANNFPIYNFPLSSIFFVFGGGGGINLIKFWKIIETFDAALRMYCKKTHCTANLLCEIYYAT